MKRMLTALTLVLLLIFSACALAEDALLIFDAETVQVAKGGSAKIDYTVTGAEDWGKVSKAVWSSSDKGIAAVSNGKVSGKKLGEADITLTLKYKNGQELTASLPATVFAPVKSIALEKNLTLGIGDAPVALTASVSPADAAYQTVIWTTSDPSVATVDENGLVTPVGGGTATITATSTQPADAKGKVPSAACKVTMIQKVESLTLSQTTARLAKGKSLTFTASVMPEGASDKSVTWSSSDDKIAKVDKKGNVSGKAPGTVTITATANDGSGKSATCEVTVYQAVTKVTGKGTKLAITKGKTKSLSVTVAPSNATDKSLTWTTSNSGVASVDKNGKITANRTGTATITATANDGSGKSASFKVTVEPAVPAYFNSISRGVFYRNRLFIDVYNANKTRSLKRVDFTVQTYNYSDKLIGTEYCYWEKKIGPNKSKSSGSWHWEVSGLSRAYKVKVTITAVTFSDGTRETVPSDVRYTQSFSY